MNNSQIIENVAKIVKYENPQNLNTCEYWVKKGRFVRTGEKSLAYAFLWINQNQNKKDADGNELKPLFLKLKSQLFGIEQTEPITEQSRSEYYKKLQNN